MQTVAYQQIGFLNANWFWATLCVCMHTSTRAVSSYSWSQLWIYLGLNTALAIRMLQCNCWVILQLFCVKNPRNFCFGLERGSEKPVAQTNVSWAKHAVHTVAVCLPSRVGGSCVSAWSKPGGQREELKRVCWIPGEDLPSVCGAVVCEWPLECRADVALLHPAVFRCPEGPQRNQAGQPSHEVRVAIGCFVLSTDSALVLC